MPAAERKEPKTQDIDAYCKACSEKVTIQILVNVPVAVAVAWMKALRCPKCQADYRELCI